MLLVMMVTMFSTNVFADDSEYEGSCGENVIYSFNGETGELVIFREGNFPESPWEEYKDNIKTVTIKDGITRICCYEFCGCKSLKEVHILIVEYY